VEAEVEFDAMPKKGDALDKALGAQEENENESEDEEEQDEGPSMSFSWFNDLFSFDTGTLESCLAERRAAHFSLPLWAALNRNQGMETNWSHGSDPFATGCLWDGHSGQFDLPLWRQRSEQKAE